MVTASRHHLTVTLHRLSILSIIGPSLSQVRRSGTIPDSLRDPALSSDRFRHVKDELISALPLSTHSAVEMFHDSALYKFTIDIDIDLTMTTAILAIIHHPLSSTSYNQSVYQIRVPNFYHSTDMEWVPKF